MNIIKELEDVLSAPNFMGGTDKVGVNLAVNAVLDKIEELNKIQEIEDARGIISNFTEEEFTDEQLLLFSKKLEDKMMSDNGQLEYKAFVEMKMGECNK